MRGSSFWQKLLLFLALGICEVVHAAAGVDADSLIEKVIVGSGKQRQEFVLMNSAMNPNQWFYALLSPTLLETGSGKDRVPDLTLIRFQKLDTKDSEKISEGAILQFSFAIGAEKSALSALKQKLPKDVNLRQVRLDPLPLDRIDMSIFNPRGKKLSLIATSSQGIAADYVSEYARFSAVFSSVDSDLVATLLKSETGIKYELNYHYATLSDPLTSAVNIDLDAGKGHGLSTDILDDSGKPVVPEIAAYIRRQLANPRVAQRLRRAAEKKTEPSTEKQVKSAYDPRTDGHQSAKSKPEQDSRISRKLHKLTLVHRSRAQKYLAAEGFLNLSGYSKDVAKKCFIEDTAYDNWAYAYLMLPSVGEITGLDFERIELKILLTDKRHTYDERKMVWKPESHWLDEHGAPARIARFSLKDILGAAGNFVDEVKFKVEYNIFISEDPPITGELSLPAFTGDLPLATPFMLADLMLFDFSNLTWDAPENDKTRLVKVEMIIQDGKRRIRKFVEPELYRNKVTLLPEQVPVLLKRDNFAEAGRVKVSVFFHTADRKRVPWDFNGMNLNESFPDAYLVFLDNDWQSQ